MLVLDEAFQDAERPPRRGILTAESGRYPFDRVLLHHSRDLVQRRPGGGCNDIAGHDI
jgi:hypothetical protein